MILSLPSYPNPVLRKRSRLLNLKQLQTGDYDNFFADLKETMVAAPGVGIAAVQVGKLWRVFFVETEQYKGIFINPILSNIGKEAQEAEEGCLSVPGKWAKVPRATRLKIEAFNSRGVPFSLKASGFLARVLQHEFDHLEGKLFIDRATSIYDRDKDHRRK